MPTPKEEDIKVRVPAAMKATLSELADQRLTTISAIAREALLQYVGRAEQLRESADGSLPPPTGKPSSTYRKALKKDTQRKILDIVKREVSQGKASPPPTK